MRYLLAPILFLFSIQAHAVLLCVTGNITSEWYVGNLFFGAGYAPLYCSATDNELQYIKQHFPTLRMRVGQSVNGGPSVVTWFGDDAQFLVNNL